MTKAKRFTRLKPFGYSSRGCMPSAAEDLEIVVVVQIAAVPAWAASSIASNSDGSIAWPCSIGEPSITRCTPLSLKARQARVVDGVGDDRLAGQFLQAEAVELVHRRDHHGGMSHRAAQHVAAPTARAARR